MKKGKLLALVLAGAITLMGAGYAAWTDNVNINATVSTAKFDIDIEDVHSYVEFHRAGQAWKPEDRVKQQSKNDESDSNDYGIIIKRELGNDNKQINYEFENLFPDSKAVIHFKMLNNSSIPLIIKNFELEVTDKDTADGLTLEKIEEVMYMSYAFNVIDNKGERIGKFYSETLPLKEAKEELSKLVNYTLEEGHSIQANDNQNKTGIWLYLPSKAGEEFQNKSIGFSINIDYAQFNDVPNK